MDIKLKVKLSAYSNLSLPNYLTDAPSDDKLYGRKDGGVPDSEPAGGL